METMSTTIEAFSEEEMKAIQEAINKLKEERSFSDRPRFWHDMILIGCQHVLTRKK